MKIRLLEAARQDLRDAWRFYENQTAGLGDYFLDAIQTDVRSLQVFAGIHEMSAGFHRLLAKRFPFAIYYRMEECVDIYAIIDCRRDPDWITQRLDVPKSDK